MTIEKQYIIQCINCAANNLRLNSEKIEVVAIIREYLGECNDLAKSIQDMKKLTKFSKFAIKLSEISNFIFNTKIDFLKISEVFKAHSHAILRELSNLLDGISPQECSEALNGNKSKEIKIELKSNNVEPPFLGDINQQEEQKTEIKISIDESNNLKSESDLLKEELILGDIKSEEELSFESFEKTIIKPIKELDAFLKKLSQFEHNHDNLILYTDMMYNHAELSEKIGFDIITNMHNIFADTMNQIKEGKLVTDNDLIEGMRACLIVITAVVRGKEVDITNYLNKAEELGKKIKTITKG